MKTNIKKDLKKKLPSYIYNTLNLIGRVAASKNYRVYIVGGFVRDLLLNKKNFDIDITVEPEAIGFAKSLAKKLKGTLVLHKRFGTATVFVKWPHKKRSTKYPGVLRIDIATARTETYKRPGALPSVSFSSIRDDLSRRDFTINAIAASLNKEGFGEIIDFFGGQKDLKKGLIRVLHDGSFIDDPTRIFRAVRFEQRFNFKIDTHTMYLIKNAVNLKMFERIGKQRIRNEIILILQEKDPIKALLRMEELQEFRFIHKKISLSKGILKTIISIKNSSRYFNSISGKNESIDAWLVYFMALLENLSLKDVERLCSEYCFKNYDKIRIIKCRKNNDKLLKLLRSSKPLKPSLVYKHLNTLELEVIFFIYAKSGKNKRIKSRIDRFLKKDNDVKLQIKGDDLKRMGIKPGPKFKDILNATLYEKIDATLKTKRDEKEFVLQKFVKR